MEHKNIKRIWRSMMSAVIALVLIVASVSYGFARISKMSKQIGFLTIELASTTASLSKNTILITQSIADLHAQTTGLSNTLSNTQQNVDAVTTKVGGVELTVGNISGTVGTLQKLSEIDPELLKKYSKVFFMNENYVPAHLTQIPSNYLYSEKQSEQFLSESWPFLKGMLDEANSRAITIYVKSGYRSFGTQQSLKSLYTVVYGAGTANSFSADQGYSEHQLGTTADFITTGLDGNVDGFDKTEAFLWLQANAYRFGFVMSYPKNNSYYVYEPWHWRFIGVKLATYLHNNNLNFYDVDQREIDKFLINVFD